MELIIRCSLAKASFQAPQGFHLHLTQTPIIQQTFGHGQTQPFTSITFAQVQSVNTTVSTTVTAVNATLSKRYVTLNSTLDNGVPAQNMSLPWRNAMTTTPTVLAVKYNDYMICRNGSYPTISGVTQNVSNVISLTSANWTYCKVNLNPDQRHSWLNNMVESHIHPLAKRNYHIRWI